MQTKGLAMGAPTIKIVLRLTVLYINPVTIFNLSFNVNMDIGL
jgi:hypothetical protein